MTKRPTRPPTASAHSWAKHHKQTAQIHAGARQNAAARHRARIEFFNRSRSIFTA